MLFLKRALASTFLVPMYGRTIPARRKNVHYPDDAMSYDESEKHDPSIILSEGVIIS
jgi:hypothetical protein